MHRDKFRASRLSGTRGLRCGVRWGKTVFARRIRVEVVAPAETRLCPLAWLDSYAMRSFTGRAAFDDTLPVVDGLLEVSFRVDLEALRSDMEDWMTRKFGQGRPIILQLVESRRSGDSS